MNRLMKLFGSWVRASKNLKTKEENKMPQYNGQELKEIKKWDVRDRLMDYMAKGTELYYDKHENGVFVKATISGVRERGGKVFFALSDSPADFVYRGGRGWYTLAPTVVPPATSPERAAALAANSAGLLEAISNGDEEAFAARVREMVAAFRISAS